MERCLSSLRGLNVRVLLMDSFSQDGTLDRAQEVWRMLGEPAASIATVARTWQGFTAARNDSLKWVRTPWVLWLDADEWLSEPLRLELPARLAAPLGPTDPKVFRLPRRSHFLGRQIRFGGWYPDPKTRLARAALCVWRAGPDQSDVHEDLFALDGSSPGRLRSDLEHEGFRNIREQEETNDRYSGLLAAGLARKWRKMGRKPPGRLFIGYRSAVKFVENYIFKLGILDGWPGFVIARGSARSLRMRLRKAGALLSEPGTP